MSNISSFGENVIFAYGTFRFLAEHYRSPIIEDIAPSGHEHCSRCVTLRCAVPVNCELIVCKNGCDVSFHSCKETDHMTICPNETICCPMGCSLMYARCKFYAHYSICQLMDNYREFAEEKLGPCKNGCGQSFPACDQEDHDLVCSHILLPCVNAYSGCTVELARHAQAKHLETCPAGVQSVVGPELIRRDEFCASNKLYATMEDNPPRQCYMCKSDYTYSSAIPKFPSGSVVNKEDTLVFESDPLPDITTSPDRSGDEVTSLEHVPYDVFSLICRYLDSLSLRNLSLTCKAVRGYCAALLGDKGVVSLKWQKDGDSWTVGNKVCFVENIQDDQEHIAFHFRSQKKKKKVL